VINAQREEEDASEKEIKAEEKADDKWYSYDELKERLGKYGKDENMLYYLIAAVVGTVGLVICGLYKCFHKKEDKDE